MPIMPAIPTSSQVAQIDPLTYSRIREYTVIMVKDTEMKGLNAMTTDTFEFTMKDAAGSYGWLLEGSTDLNDIDDPEGWVKENAVILISGQNYGDTTDEEVLQAWIDDTYEFDQAVAYIQSKIDEMQTEQALEAIVTPKEIAEDFGVKEDTVRDAIEHGWLIARKSGGTWLILRKHAEKRWGKTK